MMLTKLHVNGFRGVGPTPSDLPLAPLTVLVGPNGCGKSSFLEAVGLTAQSVVEQPDLHNIVLSGECVDFPPDAADDGGSLFFGGKPGSSITIGIEFQAIGFPEGRDDLAKAQALGLRAWPPKRVEYSWTRSSHRWPHWSHTFAVDGVTVWRAWPEVLDRGEGSVQFRNLAQIGKGRPFQVSALADRVLGRDFLPTNPRQAVLADQEVDEKKLAAVVDLLAPVVTKLREQFGRVHMVSSLRGADLMHTDVGPDVEFVGKHGEQLVRLTSRMHSKADPRLKRLNEWAERFGMPQFMAGWGGGKSLQATFADPWATSRLDYRYGAGGSQNAVLLAAQVLLTEKSSVLLFDEPELGLHPAYERYLPELFAEGVSHGQQVIVATHSEVFIAALGNAVRKRLHGITSAQVAVWHLQRSQEGIRVEPVPLSERGYLEKWVSSFAKVEEDLFQEWAEGLPEAGSRDRSGLARSGKSGQRKSVRRKAVRRGK